MGIVLHWNLQSDAAFLFMQYTRARARAQASESLGLLQILQTLRCQGSSGPQFTYCEHPLLFFQGDLVMASRLPLWYQIISLDDFKSKQANCHQ